MTTHLVCRGCDFEALLRREDVDDAVETHEATTGHEVDHQEVDDGQRLVTDGGLSWDELEQRKWRQSSTPRDERSRCPECHATAINTRSHGIYCKRCAEQYDSALEPHEDEYPDLRADGGQTLDAVAQSFANELTQVVDRHPTLRRVAPHYMAAQLVCAVDGVADRQGLDITVKELDPDTDRTIWAIEFYPPNRTPSDDPYGEFLGAPRRDDGRVAVERLPDAEYTDERLVTDGGQDRREIQVGQRETVVWSDDTVADLFERISEPSITHSVSPVNTVLCRPYSADGRLPDDDDRIGFGLDEVEDGDELELYRLPERERPAYPQPVSVPDGGRNQTPDKQTAEALERIGDELDRHTPGTDLRFLSAVIAAGFTSVSGTLAILFASTEAVLPSLLPFIVFVVASLRYFRKPSATPTTHGGEQ